MSKSKRANASLPVYFARGEGIAADSVEAMDRAAETGEATHGQHKLFRGSVDELRACVISPREGCEILYGGVLRRGKPPVQVRTLARFDVTEFLGRKYIECRPLRSGECGARELAAAYNSWGHNGNEFWGVDECPQAEPLEVEAAVNITLPSRSVIVRARIRGLWFGLGRFAQPLPPPTSAPAPAGGEAYPDIAIV